MELSRVQAIQNAGRAEVYGFEAGLEINFTPALRLTSQYNVTGGKTIEEDGIELAYQFTKDNFIENSENSVVMIRIPNGEGEVTKVESNNSKKATKKKNNAVVLTAIALLPELISVIKD